MTAARQRGIVLPSLCYRESLEHVTACMVCVVEDAATGQLHPACSTPAADGMRIVTDAETVRDARRTALELLLGDHVGDCEAPCRRACPAGLDVPAMLRAIAAGRFREAVRIVTADIALPGVLGRICSAPCEKVCRRGAHDAPVGIRLMQRVAADAATDYDPVPDGLALPTSGFRVAVIGAGPAGLAAAWHLRLAGHACTLFEKAAQPGGGLRADALRPLLPPAVLEADVARILAQGVELQTGIDVGDNPKPAAILQAFDAVILALGRAGPEMAAAWSVAHAGRGLAVADRTGRLLTASAHQPVGPAAGQSVAAAPEAERLFAAGSVILPARLAVRAVGQGHAAAASVDQWLRGRAVTGRPRRYDHRLTGTLDSGERAMLLEDASLAPRLVAADACDDACPPDAARREAARCLHCDCRKPDACKLRRYAGEWRADQRRFRPQTRRRYEVIRNAHVVYEPGKCIVCGICVRLTAQAAEPLGLSFVGRGFDVRVAVPFNEPLARGLRKVADACIAACPTGALAARKG